MSAQTESFAKLLDSPSRLDAERPALPELERDQLDIEDFDPDTISLDPGSIDVAAAERAVGDLLRALGRDLDDPHLSDTPRRVAGAFQEMLTPRPANWTTFPNEDGYAELVLVRNVPFHSLCQHHLLPFRGVAHIGYLPADRLFGLSKLARGLELFSRDLQVQERLTRQLADWLVDTLNPRGVGVVLEAEHMCMSLRGVQASGTVTRTSTFYGELSTSGPLRDQFPH